MTDEAKEEELEDVTLKTAILSLDIATGDPAENRRRASRMLAMLPADTDVAVLPELFTTSFMRDTDAMLGVAEDRDGATMRFLTEEARAHDLLLAGSFLVKEAIGNGQHKYYNRGFMVFPDGTHNFYDKHHLFCLSPEAQLITHGHKRPPVMHFRGWNVSMIICYELRFPVWDRNVGMQTDVVLVPANWPDTREYAWRQLLIARSIENQVVMVGANRSGRDDYGEYSGSAMITDELGRQVIPPLPEPPKGCPPPTLHGEIIPTPYGPILAATLSMAKLRKLRTWLPTHRDADKFLIHGRNHEV